MNILEVTLNLGILTKVVDKFPYLTNFSRLITKLNCLGKKRNWETSNDLEKYQELAKREPCNPNAHLNLARIYEKKGARQQAFAEYFLVAEIFFRNGLYPNALAIYKRILEQDPSLDQIKLKIANTYQKIDLLEKAFSQYSQLLHHYQGLGMKDKAKEIMTLLDGFNQKNFEPDEKAYLKYRLVKELSKCQENGNAGPSRKEKEETMYGFKVVRDTLGPGSAINMAHGMKKLDPDMKVLAITQEDHFFHSGMPAFVNTLYNNSSYLLVIMTNEKEQKIGKVLEGCGFHNFFHIDNVSEIEKYKGKRDLTVLFFRGII